MFRCKLTIFISQILAKFTVQSVRHQLTVLFLFCLLLSVSYNPDICGNPRIVKQVIRHLHNGIKPVIFDNIPADIALTATGIARKQAAPVMN